MRRVQTLVFALLCLVALAARAAHTQATLVLSDDTAKPGDTVWIGVDLKMDPGWHTYWKNSGDAGIPTTIAWQLPPGVTAGDIQWPLPQKFPPVEVTTYGYEGETMLLVPLTIGTNVPPGPITLTANLAWLECQDVCIPVKTSVQATLTIGNETKLSTNASTIQRWQENVPGTNYPGDLTVWWEGTSTNDVRSLGFVNTSSRMKSGWQIPEPVEMPARITPADFFPDSFDNFEVQPLTYRNVVDQHFGKSDKYEFWFSKEVKKYSGDWPKEISGVLTLKDGQIGYYVKLPIQEKEPEYIEMLRTGHLPSSEHPSESSSSLAKYLFFAFIGGLILNVMPCVLPVIALKILGFVSEAHSEPRRVRNLGFIYALGVLASFSVLAAIFIGLKQAGQRIGWGMQFSSPVFVVCLTTLITLVALNLFGVFEVVPGGKVMDTAGDLASKHGAAGAFFNGLLATTLATPCTAAYMAGALGFAFAQSAGVIFLVLLFVGLGLAAPYVLLSCNPAFLKFLPKPGPWMEKFKIAMGFPMLVTVVWLFSVAASDYGARVLWLGIFLVIVALAAWVFGEFVQRGRRGKGIAIAIVLILLIGGYSYALEARLDWRKMITENDAGGSTSSLIETSANGVVWQPWSLEAIAQARAAGKLVIVDFTASWCVTCNAIVKPALEKPDVVAKLKALNATALLGDYTRSPQPMTEEISKYGSAGVPLVLVFPKNPDATAIVLRQPGPIEFPSSYSKAILAALAQAEGQ